MCHHWEDTAAPLAELNASFDFLVRTLERDEGRGLTCATGRPWRRLEKIMRAAAA